MPIGEPHQAILIPEEALGSDQGQRFLYVVDDKNKVVYRPVQVGSLHGKLRVIKSGLAEGDRVVLEGLQRVRPGNHEVRAEKRRSDKVTSAARENARVTQS